MKYFILAFMVVSLPARALTKKQVRELTQPATEQQQTTQEEPKLIMCADGSYVKGERCLMCPDGTYTGAKRCTMAADGTYH